MASGIPVISTDAGGVRELIAGMFSSRQALCGMGSAECRAGNAELTAKEGEFEVCERGILVKPGDAEGLAFGLKYLVENHTRLKKEMSGRARIFVEQNFSKERLLHDIESLYLELLAKGT